ncbi:MAG TPA: DUF4388 domain-containing protein, partial [Thermoanaerobaculia bacterium]|nr:DUF4388 domain-containing protein [Thermoanaerobaculia bacterium]
AISFLNGRIVAADALNQTLEEGLSQILLKEGVISAPDLSRAASEHQSAGGRLVDLLVERRYIERSQLLDAMRLQTWRLLEQLMRWDQGDFKFYSGDEVSYEEGFVPIAVDDFLLHAAQKAHVEAASRPAPRPVPAPTPAAAPPPAPAVPQAAPRPDAAPAPGPRPVPAGPRPVAAPAPRAVPAAAAAAEEPEGSGPFVKMKVEPRPAPPASLGWVSRTLAILLAALVIAALVRTPDSLLIPFPWQTSEREAFARDQRSALYLKIDRAAKTWFLLEGSFPERLTDLVTARLLSPSDLRDPQGRPLRYIAQEESYALQPLAWGKPVGAEASEAISGNFLLDPEFLRVPPESSTAPLVLLD